MEHNTSTKNANDEDAITDSSTAPGGNTTQLGTSHIETSGSVGSDGEDASSSVSSEESVSEWRQFWTLLSPIPDGVQDFRWVCY